MKECFSRRRDQTELRKLRPWRYWKSKNTIFFYVNEQKVSKLDDNNGFINLRFLQKMNCQRRSGTRLDSQAWYNGLTRSVPIVSVKCRVVHWSVLQISVVPFIEFCVDPFLLIHRYLHLCNTELNLYTALQLDAVYSAVQGLLSCWEVITKL